MMNNKPQQESALKLSQLRLMREWNDSIPDGAFCDDPSAEGYDRHGRTRAVSSAPNVVGGLDLGMYPASD